MDKSVALDTRKEIYLEQMAHATAAGYAGKIETAAQTDVLRQLFQLKSRA